MQMRIGAPYEANSRPGNPNCTCLSSPPTIHPVPRLGAWAINKPLRDLRCTISSMDEFTEQLKGRLRGFKIGDFDVDELLASSPSTLIAIVVGVWLLFSAIARVRAWYRLRHIPGPWLAGWTDFWLIRTTWHLQVFNNLGQACKDYGEFCTLPPACPC